LTISKFAFNSTANIMKIKLPILYIQNNVVPYSGEKGSLTKT